MINKNIFRSFKGAPPWQQFLIYIPQAISITQSGMPKDRLRLAFKLYDIDRNGYVEIHEMVEVIKVCNCTIC
jgi:Ca2+-binding EF-hand superfamily protein